MRRSERTGLNAVLQVGEFAFVLLSLASQLGLVNTRLGMLLLGVTAISLMMTPLVLGFASRLIDSDHAPIPSVRAWLLYTPVPGKRCMRRVTAAYIVSSHCCCVRLCTCHLQPTSGGTSSGSIVYQLHIAFRFVLHQAYSMSLQGDRGRSASANGRLEGQRADAHQCMQEDDLQPIGRDLESQRHARSSEKQKVDEVNVVELSSSEHRHAQSRHPRPHP